MKNTGITYTSAERSPVILPEMAELLPPLSAEQLDALEADLIKNGCYAPIIVNEDMVIIDGHNRQALCEKHDLPYMMAVFSFEDLLEAKQWALDTQKGRRNLEKWELGKIALKLKPEIEAKARANQSAAGGDKFSEKPLSATLPEAVSAVDTRKELAEAVGLGERTMGKVMQIDENRFYPLMGGDAVGFPFYLGSVPRDDPDGVCTMWRTAIRPLSQGICSIRCSRR